MSYCPHDDDPNTCPPCRRGGRPWRPPTTRDTAPSARFPAAYAGPCAGCDDPIAVGDLIYGTTLERDGTLERRRYWHAHHGEELDR